MKIGIVGTGNMGRHLGLLWAEQGHEVLFGSRTEAKAKAAAELSEHAVRSGTNREAAEFGEVILYTIRNADPVDVVGDVALLDAKVVIDCTNGDVPANFDYQPITVALAEVLQGQLPAARVVKAYNTIPNEVFELCPDLIAPAEVSVFIAGDDPEARATVAGLTAELGLDPVDCGSLGASRRIEAVAQLLIQAIIEAGEFYTTLTLSKLDQPGREIRLGGREMSEQTKEDLAAGA